MLIDDLRAQKKCLTALCNRYGAEHQRVFGAVARGEETPDSDMEFLVVFPRGNDMFAQRWPLTEGLARLLHRHVDVIPEHELSPHIRDQVLSEATAL